jgi:glycosyltransferase involved in cell wall biosynthesis
MKVLCVHNYYGSAAPSGENVAFDCDVDLLAQHGHEVLRFTTHSDELRAKRVTGRVRGAFTCIWNPAAETRLRALIGRERPDIMHVHNVFPRLSPAILSAADCTGTATVLTLHNYRIFCAAGTAMRAGAVCTLCGDQHSVKPALRHRCYRNSLLATVPIATSIALHRSLGTLSTFVDAFIALTQFQRDFFVDRGLLPAERMHVRANFMPGAPQPMDWRKREARVVFVGRLSDDKGVDVALAAWKLWGADAPELVVIGDGPRRRVLERMAREQIRRNQIRFLGYRTAADTHAMMRAARLVVVPSRAFEGFPMVIREAIAFGVPIVASDVGALADIVAHSGCGVAFTVGDPVALMQVARALWNDPQRMQRIASNAVEVYGRLYSERAAYDALMQVYAQAQAERRATGGDPLRRDPASAAAGRRRPGTDDGSGWSDGR